VPSTKKGRPAKKFKIIHNEDCSQEFSEYSLNQKLIFNSYYRDYEFRNETLKTLEASGFLGKFNDKYYVFCFAYDSYILKAIEITEDFITQHNLKIGDYIVVRANEFSKNNELPIASELIENKCNEANALKRKNFQTERIIIEKKRINFVKTELSSNLNNKVQIYNGDRILVLSKEINMLDNCIDFMSSIDNDVEKIVVLFDSLPENITYIKQKISNAKVFYTNFGDEETHKRFVLELALEHAQRLCENNKNVMIYINEFNKVILESMENNNSNQDKFAKNVYKITYSTAKVIKNASLTICASSCKPIYLMHQKSFNVFLDSLVDLTVDENQKIDYSKSWSKKTR